MPAFDEIMVQLPLIDPLTVCYVLDAYIDLNGAMAHARQLGLVCNILARDGLAMPQVRRRKFANWIWDGSAELGIRCVDELAAVEVVVGHEL